MITPNDYISAIEAKLHEKFNSEPVYLDVVPENFKRPSNEIETVKFTMQQTGAYEVVVSTELLIRTFVPVDLYHNSSYQELYLRAMRIMGIFACGYLRVSDSGTGERRAPKVTALSCPTTGKDYAEIRVTLRLDMAKEDFEPQPVKPIMEEFDLNVDIQK